MTESDQPPAYPTHAGIPPSSEAITAPVYTPRHSSVDDHDDTSPLQPSRNLPTSRPLQRPDRLVLTNQSTTINIGPVAESLANTTTEPNKSKNKGDGADVAVSCCGLFCLALLITMICTAVVLNNDAEALDKNSRVLKELQDEMLHAKETPTSTITRWDASTVTLTAVIRSSESTVFEEYVEIITETVTHTVNNYLATTHAGNAWVTSTRSWDGPEAGRGRMNQNKINIVNNFSTCRLLC